MTREQFFAKYGGQLSGFVDLNNDLEALLDDYDTVVGGTIGLLHTFPTGLSDMLSEEVMEARARLNGDEDG